MQEYNSLPAHLKYQLQCGFGSKKYFKGFFASCNKSCFYYNPTNQQFSAEIINCSEFCCIIEKEICYNTTTNSMEINETWTNNVIGPESCFPPLIGTCFGSFGSTDCFPICDTE